MPELIRLVTTDSKETLPAIWALGEIGDSRAVPYLVRILGNGRLPCVRAVAAVSLLKLNDPEGIRMVRLCYGQDANL
ncbi:MAG: HEAT repeat domain-containing protein [Methanomicrobiaceae archaeon]|nr:HEAT repeat domain-containing protein [Methanomicrobiaceae archaeon]